MKSAWLVLLIFGYAATAAAQMSPGRWELFAEGGASISNDHFNDSEIAFGNPPTTQSVLNTTHVPTSGRLFTGFRFWFHPHEAFEFSYSYAPSNIIVTSFCENVNCGGVITPAAARAHFFAANYVRSFHLHRLQMFVTGGIGWVYLHRVGQNPVFHSPPLTVNLGIGMDIRLTRQWAIRAEDRDWLFEGPRITDFENNPTGLTHNQVPSIGLSYRF